MAVCRGILAEITGLERDAHLNGRAGRVLELRSTREGLPGALVDIPDDKPRLLRLTNLLPSDLQGVARRRWAEMQKKIAAAAAKGVPFVGAEVEVHGLAKQVELNGQRGFALCQRSCSDGSPGMVVLMETGTRVLRVANLRPSGGAESMGTRLVEGELVAIEDDEDEDDDGTSTRTPASAPAKSPRPGPAQIDRMVAERVQAELARKEAELKRRAQELDQQREQEEQARQREERLRREEERRKRERELEIATRQAQLAEKERRMEEQKKKDEAERRRREEEAELLRQQRAKAAEEERLRKKQAEEHLKLLQQLLRDLEKKDEPAGRQQLLADEREARAQEAQLAKEDRAVAQKAERLRQDSQRLKREAEEARRMEMELRRLQEQKAAEEGAAGAKAAAEARRRREELELAEQQRKEEEERRNRELTRREKEIALKEQEMQRRVEQELAKAREEAKREAARKVEEELRRREQERERQQKLAEEAAARVAATQKRKVTAAPVKGAAPPAAAEPASPPVPAAAAPAAAAEEEKSPAPLPPPPERDEPAASQRSQSHSPVSLGSHTDGQSAVGVDVLSRLEEEKWRQHAIAGDFKLFHSAESTRRKAVLEEARVDFSAILQLRDAEEETRRALAQRETDGRKLLGYEEKSAWSDIAAFWAKQAKELFTKTRDLVADEGKERLKVGAEERTGFEAIQRRRQRERTERAALEDKEGVERAKQAKAEFAEWNDLLAYRHRQAQQRAKACEQESSARDTFEKEHGKAWDALLKAKRLAWIEENKRRRSEREKSWRSDAEAHSCESCGQVWSLTRRRHHCRDCGGVYCAVCSMKRVALPELGYETPVRVCDRCALHAFWTPDQGPDGSACRGCGARFGLVTRRHHCRACGLLFCAKCATRKVPLLDLGYLGEHRVCDSCYDQETAYREYRAEEWAASPRARDLGLASPFAQDSPTEDSPGLEKRHGSMRRDELADIAAKEREKRARSRTLALAERAASMRAASSEAHSGGGGDDQALPERSPSPRPPEQTANERGPVLVSEDTE